MLELFKDSRKRKQLIFTYITYTMNGMLALSIGSLMPFIRDARGLDYAFCGILVSMHSVGNMLSSFFTGPLSLTLGRRKTILLFNAGFGLAYALMIFGHNKTLLVLACLLTGVARGATTNFSNVTISNLATGKAWLVNSLHATFSLGAFLFPIMLMLVTMNASKHWIYMVWFMLLMGVVSWVLYSAMPVDELSSRKDKTARVTWGFLREPMFFLCTFTLFFYLCAEQGVVGWLVTYFKDTGLLDASQSQIMASVQWVMILAGRLTTAYLSTKMNKATLMRIMGMGLVVFFVVLITGTATWQIVIGIIGFGYSMAGIYPTTISYAGTLIQKYPISWSFVLTIAGLGSVIMPTVIGKIAEAAGIMSGMSSILVVIVVDLLLILLLTAYVKRKGIVD